jgi:hypothetical protein
VHAYFGHDGAWPSNRGEGQHGGTRFIASAVRIASGTGFVHAFFGHDGAWPSNRGEGQHGGTRFIASVVRFIASALKRTNPVSTGGLGGI